MCPGPRVKMIYRCIPPLVRQESCNSVFWAMHFYGPRTHTLMHTYRRCPTMTVLGAPIANLHCANLHCIVQICIAAVLRLLTLCVLEMCVKQGLSHLTSGSPVVEGENVVLRTPSASQHTGGGKSTHEGLVSCARNSSFTSSLNSDIMSASKSES